MALLVSEVLALLDLGAPFSCSSVSMGLGAAPDSVPTFLGLLYSATSKLLGSV